jgi:hypothetical protein
MCGKTLTFPAIPPGKSGYGKALGLAIARSTEPDPQKKWGLKWPAALAALGRFQHWSVVALCIMPLALVAALRIGANYAKTRNADSPSPASTPMVRVDPHAWDNMTALAKADEAVRFQVQQLNAAHAAVRAAQSVLDSVRHMNSSQSHYAEQSLCRAEAAEKAARKRLDDAISTYQRLGGTLDYRSQVRSF